MGARVQCGGSSNVGATRASIPGGTSGGREHEKKKKIGPDDPYRQGTDSPPGGL